MMGRGGGRRRGKSNLRNVLDINGRVSFCTNYRFHCSYGSLRSQITCNSSYHSIF